MNFNTILNRMGINPDNFINADNKEIRTSNGFIYQVIQRTDRRECPYCNSTHVVINDYDFVEINCSCSEYLEEVLRIKKVRFKCRNCNRTFTPPIEGIERYSKISAQVMNSIISDFSKNYTFTQIAERYGLTVARVVQIFDDHFSFVPRRPLPRVLCIDEIRFHDGQGHKYCCVLYDHDKKEIVDIVQSRQTAYLDEYFKAIPFKERSNVQYFISDMYDGYAHIHSRFFPNAIHIIDLFHIISQLTTAINKIRIHVMKTKAHKNSVEYRFMKSHWRYFLCRNDYIPNKYVEPKNSGVAIHFSDLVFRCLLLDHELMTSYNILQDLYKYYLRRNFVEAMGFIEYISKRLIDSDVDELKKVGSTYLKWKIGISNRISRSQNQIHYTNAIAEGLNNQLKTIIKAAYGYNNFERFRKRALIIITYKKSR